MLFGQNKTNALYGRIMTESDYSIRRILFQVQMRQTHGNRTAQKTCLKKHIYRMS